MKDQFHDLRDEIFDNTLKNQKDTYNNTLESFEVYSARMKEKMHATTEEYLDHLQLGYSAIIDKIASKFKQIP